MQLDAFYRELIGEERPMDTALAKRDLEFERLKHAFQALQKEHKKLKARLMRRDA